MRINIFGENLTGYLFSILARVLILFDIIPSIIVVCFLRKFERGLLIVIALQDFFVHMCNPLLLVNHSFPILHGVKCIG